MPSIADTLADANVARAVDLERVKEGLRRKILAQLRTLESELVARLLQDDSKAALGRPGVMTQRKRQRLETLLQQTRATITGAFKSIGAASVADLERIVRAEAEFAAGAINTAIKVELASVALSTAQLKAVVNENLILGSPLKEWWQEQDRRLQLAFTREMRLGYLAGETVDELIARVRGRTDKATGLRVGGIMDATRRGAETLTRTAVQGLANAARMETYRQNADIVRGVTALVTLDSRTCLLSGTMVETREGPRPIETIKPGDVVLGGSGLPRRVHGTKRSGTAKVAVVRLSNGATIRCTPDHLFLVEGQTWVEAKDLSHGQKLAERLEIL